MVAGPVETISKGMGADDARIGALLLEKQRLAEEWEMCQNDHSQGDISTDNLLTTKHDQAAYIRISFRAPRHKNNSEPDSSR
jgi:hypothetical protein